MANFASLRFLLFTVIFRLSCAFLESLGPREENAANRVPKFQLFRFYDLSKMPLFGLQDRVQACRGHRHGSGPPQLDPICSHNINRRSMKFCIQLQYSNTQGISSRFFEIWKKVSFFYFLKHSKKQWNPL